MARLARRSSWALFALASATLAPASARAAIIEDDRAKAAECLTLAIAYEAGFEPVEGQQAVAEVVLNRARHRAYPKTVCGVVFQGSQRRTGCQFTFTCDGALNRRLPDAVLDRARTVALAALAGSIAPVLGGATHYHADYVRPYWALSLVRVASIGAHIFYRMPGTVSARRDGANDRWIAPPTGPALPPAPASSARFAPWGLPPASR